MQIAVYSTALATILMGMVGLIIVTRFRAIRAAEQARAAQLIDVSRYRPLQRLLSQRDLALVAGDKQLTRVLKQQRYKVFRGYLRCLTKDFGALLGGVRLMMVESTVDRPDLAILLFRSKLGFAVSLCRIEAMLWLYKYGLATPNLNSLVEKLQSLGSRVERANFLPAAA